MNECAGGQPRAVMGLQLRFKAVLPERFYAINGCRASESIDRCTAHSAQAMKLGNETEQLRHERSLFDWN